jgi:hypothetical protein
MTPAPDSLTPVPTSPDARDDTGLTPAERLIAAMFDRGLRARGVPVERSPAAVDAAVARASKALGADQADALKRAVSSRACGELLDVVAAAKGDAGRKLALRAARELASLVAEHRLESASAVALAVDAAVWSSRAWSTFAESTASETPNDEATTRAHDRASARASQSLSAALRIEAEAKASKPKPAAFAWPVLVQPDPFPSRPRVPIDEAEDEQDDEPEHADDDEDDAAVETGRPNPGLGEREEETPKPAVMVVPEVWSLALPSGVAMGGRRGMAPAFAIVPIDPTTGRAQPTRPSGPTPAAKREMRSKGWEWSDGEQRWVSTKGAIDERE